MSGESWWEECGGVAHLLEMFSGEIRLRLRESWGVECPVRLVVHYGNDVAGVLTLGVYPTWLCRRLVHVGEFADFGRVVEEVLVGFEDDLMSRDDGFLPSSVPLFTMGD